MPARGVSGAAARHLSTWAGGSKLPAWLTAPWPNEEKMGKGEERSNVLHLKAHPLF